MCKRSILSCGDVMKITGTKKTFYVDNLEELDLSQIFKVGFDPIRIKYLGENFQKLLENRLLPGEAFHQYEARVLSAEALCEDFTRHFGNRCFTSLSLVGALLLKQPYGEAGILLTNGKTNIFVVSEAGGHIFSVGVFWYQGGWSIRAYPFTTLDGKNRKWFVGNQIILKK